MLALGLLSAGFNLEGNAIVCRLIPNIQKLCSYGFCEDIFSRREVAAIGVLAWMCHKLAFCIFDQSVILFAQAVLLLASFVTLFAYFKNDILRAATWTALLLFSLFLIGSANKFNLLLGAAILSFTALIMMLGPSPSRILSRLVALSIFVLVFLSLCNLPSVFSTDNLRFLFPTGLFALCLAGVWLSFFRKKNAFNLLSLLPCFFLLELLAPYPHCFVPPLTLLLFSILVLPELIRNLKLTERARSCKTIVAALVFSLIAISFLAIRYAPLERGDGSSASGRSFWAQATRNAKEGEALVFHSEKAKDAKVFKSLFLLHEELSSLLGGGNVKKVTFLQIVFLVLLVFVFESVIILLVFPQRSFITVAKNAALLGSSFLIALPALWISYARLPFSLDKAALWSDCSLLLFPLCTMLIFSLAQITCKIFLLPKRNGSVFSFLLSLLAIPSLILYAWPPNSQEIFKGTFISGLNYKYSSLFRNLSLPASERLVVLSKKPLDKLDVCYAMMNFGARLPKKIALHNLKESYDKVAADLFSADHVLYIPDSQLKGADKASEKWPAQFFASDLANAETACVLKPEFVSGHLLFSSASSVLTSNRYSANLLSDTSFEKELSLWNASGITNAVFKEGGVKLTKEFADQKIIFSQDIPLTSGKWYRLSASATSDTLIPYVSFRDADTGKPVARSLYFYKANVGPCYATRFIRPKKDTIVRVAFSCAQEELGWFEFKDISFTMDNLFVPENEE